MNSLRLLAVAAVVAFLGSIWPSQTAAQQDPSGSPVLTSTEQDSSSSSQSKPSAPLEQKSNPRCQVAPRFAFHPH